ncbi:MAG: gliding motility-associated C-terminal domain-containing protein [Bacteroidales bacterium]|nr:gliding motility-associated C-terminal domain-containing protein [Bacteroidales bacterium]
MNKRLASILIIILFFFQITSQGQTVRLRCTEVMPNGDAVIQWNPVLIGTGFYNYTIYFSLVRSGFYTELTVITNITQASYLHVGADANTTPGYYYLIINKNSGPFPTDTLATMLLTGTTTDFEVIDFNWTPLHTPLLAAMHPWYLLYREYPPGTWAVVDSTQDLSLTHHFWACNGNSDTVRFRIGVRDIQTGCISLSNQNGAVLRNLSNRYPPVIDSVSIGPDGKAVVGWEAGLEPDIQGYTIFRVTTTNDSIDYVDGSSATYYRHEDSNPCEGPLRYILLSIDSCGNESPFPFDTSTFQDKPHSTIFLADVAYDPCTMTNTLSWNEYVNFEPPLQGYRIYMSENNGPFQLLETLNPGQTSYTHADLQPNTTYAYYIRAFNQDGLKTSTSCRKEVTTYNSPRPLFMYTRFVSVEDNERVNILFYTDTAAHVQFYRILRSTNAGGPYTETGTVLNQGQEFVSFSDAAADVTVESYYYQVEVVDSCGMASVITNTARTIFLQAEALPDLTNRLSWNAYESWYGRILGYKVYRRLDNSSLTMLADVDSLTLTYSDNVSDLTGTISRITYLVEAYEGSANPLGFQEQSFSNEVLSEQEPKVYLPNAFMPRGLNNTLKPVIVFVGSEGYEFLVYNRWGQLIYRTNDPNDAWNGTYNGEYVPQGVYVYLLRFRNALNQPRQIKGNIAVIY